MAQIETGGLPTVNPTKKYPNEYNVCGCGNLKKKQSNWCAKCRHLAKRSPANAAVILVNGVRCRLIPLTQGKHARINESDYGRVSLIEWYAIKQHGAFYAGSQISDENGKKVQISMHRWILNASPEVEVDHIDGDGLNNTRANIRIAKHKDNAKNRKLHRNNTSGYKGVSWHKRSQMWMAYITSDKKRRHLGYFFDLDEAARVYNAAASALHGTFARPNSLKSSICE